MSSDYSLRVYQPVLQGDAFVEDITLQAIAPEPSHLFNGGFWQLPFRLKAQLNNPESAERLITRFQTWLGHHVEERYEGEVSWEGMICQIDLVWGRTRKRRSLIDTEMPTHNAVRSTYSGGTTSWQTDDNSIARYGRIETTLQHDTLGSGGAGQMATMHLQKYAWPRAYMVSRSDQLQTPALDILACGYIVTTAWQNVAAGVKETDIETLIDNLISNDCEFLDVGNIAGNTWGLSVVEGETPYEQLQYALAFGNASDEQFRYYVGKDRQFYYEKVDYSPRYRVSADGIRERQGGPLINKRRVRPGVFRDEEWPIIDPPPNSPFESDQDGIVDEVIIRHDKVVPELRSQNQDADLYAAKVEYVQRDVEREKSAAQLGSVRR